METIKINGIEYTVKSARPFQVEGKHRFHLRLQRPNGKKNYCAIKYENGAISSVVSIG